uniref:Uncharacterized protein n=1 Tax=Pseudomonas phage HRDY3 TaxID=3236930 RepID=A0AB39CEP4_9VIRU
MTATKTLVKSVPAFDVVDLNQEIIDLPFGSMGDGIGKPGLRFCVAKETMRHGTLYPEVAPNCSAYYAMEYNEDPVAAEARCIERKHELYWVNNCASSLVSHDRARWEMVLLKPGQKIHMHGRLMEFYRKGNSDHYGLREIA